MHINGIFKYIQNKTSQYKAVAYKRILYAEQSTKCSRAFVYIQSVPQQIVKSEVGDSNRKGQNKTKIQNNQIAVKASFFNYYCLKIR